MANINVMYKGNSIARFSDGNKTLETSGKYCEDDIQIRVEPSQNDILFHFDTNMYNYGKSPALFSDDTGLELSAAQHKFGTHSLKCGSTQKINNMVISPSLAFQSYDFTLDFWMYPTYLEEYTSDSGSVPFSATYRSLAIYLFSNCIKLCVTHKASTWDYETPEAVSLSTDTWYHIAVVRSGSKIYLFLDGVKKIEINYGVNEIAKSYPFTLASNTYSSGDRRFRGYIDEFRYIQGTAVWTADFTPPTEPYV